MLRFTREQIHQAFFQLASAATIGQEAAFKTVSRRVRPISEIVDQPALMMEELGQMADNKGGGIPTIWTFHVRLWVMFRSNQPIIPLAPDEEVIPAQTVNLLLDALETALTTGLSGDGRQQLANLPGQTPGQPMVSWARIQGNVEIDEGLLDNQGVILVPCVILATL